MRSARNTPRLRLRERWLCRAGPRPSATGQTGILIAGQGVPIDAIVSDFIAGAAETLSPDNDRNHWDIIEGQGSLFHPAYAGVALGLLHGSQPDAIILCHAAGRTHIEGYPDYPIPDLETCIEVNLRMAGLTDPAVRCAGISVNCATLAADEREDLLGAISDRFGLRILISIRWQPDRRRSSRTSPHVSTDPSWTSRFASRPGPSSIHSASRDGAMTRSN